MKKILFALNNNADNVIENSIAAEYTKEFEEEISYHSEFHLEGVEKALSECTYDVLMLKEDLEANNPISIEYLDKLTDKHPNLRIIFVLNNEHKNDEYVKRLFSIPTIYNGIYKEYLKLSKIAALIHTSRTKAEAKLYYEIDDIKSIDVSSKSIEEIDETQIQTIIYNLNSANEENISGIFEDINKQYNEKQMKFLVALLSDEIILKLEQSDNKTFKKYVKQVNDEISLETTSVPDTKKYLFKNFRNKSDDNYEDNVKEIKVEVIKEVKVPQIIKEIIEKEKEVISNANIAIISNSSNGKSFISKILAECFSQREYPTTLINIDKWYSSNILYGIDETEMSALKFLDKPNEVADKAYEISKYLKVITNEFMSEDKLSSDQLIMILNNICSESNITIMDLASEISEVLKTAILYSNTVIFVFDSDFLHFKLNIKMLEDIKSILNPSKTIVVINNVFEESKDVKYIRSKIESLGMKFKDIVTIRNCGSAASSSIFTDKSAYSTTDNELFKNDVNCLMNSLKAKGKKESILKKIFKR